METAPYYHAVIGDVDIKVKVVACGQPGEAVMVHCSRHGRHAVWSAETELQAREILSWVKERFAGSDYKLIPVPAPQGLGLKIHPVYTNFATAGKQQAPASEVTLELFSAIRAVIEENNNGRVFIRHKPNQNERGGNFQDHALRREIERIIRSSGHVETKVREITRLIGAA